MNTPSSGDQVSPPRRLDSWKEIAAYFGRDRTVVIRWEKERGLPVHRLPGGGKARVFAYVDELDAWLASDRPAEKTRAAVPGRVWAALAGVAVVLGVSAAVWANRAVTEAVADVAYTTDSVIARDRHQREVFRVDFPGQVLVHPPRPGLGLLARTDLTGDGRADNLITVPLKMGDGTTTGADDRLLAMTDEGTMLWTAQGTADPEFGAGRFSPGYQTTALLPFAWEGRQLIAWSQTHHTWWPTILRVLDQNGASRSTWVHGGVFFALSFVMTNEGPLLLAGGVSNSQSAGVLIALDLRAANGHGPEPPATTFACANCSGTDLPVHYLAFPPTEMSAAFGVPYSRVYAINATAQGIEVRVRQGSLAGKDGVDVIYDFDTGFRLLRAHVADDYWLVHRQLEAKGVLHHRVEECPERRAPLGIRELSATGWRVVVPLEPAR